VASRELLVGYTGTILCVLDSIPLVVCFRWVLIVSNCFGVGKDIYRMDCGMLWIE
jgi:hypothetical protein